MQFHSTRNAAVRASWREAVLSGIAPDGGLYVPSSIPQVSIADIQKLRGKSFAELATHLTQVFLGDDMDSHTISGLCADSLDFEVPLRKLDSSLHILELFHGPTCAFKDFGARFMARLFKHFWGDSSTPLTVLVATSGDTGSAVANAFFDPALHPTIKVAILFPKNKVSEVQRKQMTTLGHNVTALEVDGSFDDCQSLVKQALQDRTARRDRAYTSANSINIARLLPQMFYYAYATLQLPLETPPTFVVPSGNLGNITGAILAHMCGFRASRCIAACNANSTLPDFLSTGVFQPRPSQETISNAMDVGAPSNFFRINSLMGATTESTLIPSNEPRMQLLSAYTISDEATRDAMKLYHSRYNYVLDPHTAVGAAALDLFRQEYQGNPGPFVIAATAHPAKFSDVVESALHLRPELPPQLAQVLNKPEHAIPLAANYSALAERLAAI